MNFYLIEPSLVPPTCHACEPHETTTFFVQSRQPSCVSFVFFLFCIVDVLLRAVRGATYLCLRDGDLSHSKVNFFQMISGMIGWCEMLAVDLATRQSKSNDLTTAAPQGLFILRCSLQIAWSTSSRRTIEPAHHCAFTTTSKCLVALKHGFVALLCSLERQQQDSD